MTVGFLELKALLLLPFKISGLFLRLFKVVIFLRGTQSLELMGSLGFSIAGFLSKQFRFWKVC